MRTILPPGKKPWSRWHHRLHQQLLDDPSLLPQGSSLLLAISGGQDSITLTRLLLDLREHHHWQLRLWHGNHHWRDDAQANADHLQSVAAAWQLPLSVECAAEPLASEAAARSWRYKRLQAEAEARNCSVVLTAHTASDRAETLLFHLIRGADLAGLASLRRQRALGRGLKVARPLLSFSRSDTHACCDELQLPIWLDSTNQDRRYSRNRLRLDVLPQLEALNTGATSHIARTAQLFEHLDAQQQALESLALETLLLNQGSNSLDRGRWQSQPAGVQQRLLHRWVEYSCQLRISRALTTELWRRLQTPGRLTAIDLPNGWRLKAEASMLQLTHAQATD